MLVWLVKIGEHSPYNSDSRKMRTSLMAEKLINRGHEVMWWTSAYDHYKKQWLFRDDTEITINDGYRIHFIKGTGYTKNVSLNRYLDHRYIAYKFKKLISKLRKPHIIIASTPSHDLAYEAIRYARSNKIPSILDIRDPWPDIFIEHVPSSLSIFAEYFLSGDYKKMSYATRECSAITAVTKTLLNFGLRYANRGQNTHDRVFYNGYKPPSRNVDNGQRLNAITEQIKGRFVVTFIGTFSKYHDPSILLECASKSSPDEFVFIIAGNGEGMDILKHRASSFSNVFFPGWLNAEEIDHLLSVSNVGICPTEYNIDLLPNKAVLYFYAGIPVISAFQGDLKEIIEKYNAGFNYDFEDYSKVIASINALKGDAVMYNEMSSNSRNIYDDYFNEDIVYNKYVEYIENVRSSFSNSATYP